MTQPPSTQPPSGPPAPDPTSDAAEKQAEAADAQSEASSAQSDAEKAQAEAAAAQAESDQKPSEESADSETSDSSESEEGPIKGRYSRESVPEPRVVLSTMERSAAEHAERVRHNERTGGGEVHEGELQEAAEVHLRRTAGISSEADPGAEAES